MTKHKSIPKFSYADRKGSKTSRNQQPLSFWKVPGWSPQAPAMPATPLCRPELPSDSASARAHTQRMGTPIRCIQRINGRWVSIPRLHTWTVDTKLWLTSAMANGGLPGGIASTCTRRRHWVCTDVYCLQGHIDDLVTDEAEGTRQQDRVNHSNAESFRNKSYNRIITDYVCSCVRPIACLYACEYLSLRSFNVRLETVHSLTEWKDSARWLKFIRRLNLSAKAWLPLHRLRVDFANVVADKSCKILAGKSATEQALRGKDWQRGRLR